MASAEPATMNPEKNIAKNAGPSAASANEKSRPHDSQRDLSPKKPWNNDPFPQRGQRPASPRMMGTRSDERSSAAMHSTYAQRPQTEEGLRAATNARRPYALPRPTHRCRRTGTARPRRRSANTRRRTQSRDAASV